MIHGEKINLRPVKAADLDIMHSRSNDPAFEGEYNNFGLNPANHLQRLFEFSGFMSSKHGMLVVENLDGEFVGTVDYRNVRYGPNDGSNQFAIGISLAAEYHGKGYGVEAQRLLADYLFRTYPIMRVEASTDVTNIAEQRALEKAGFTRELIIRKAQWRGGAWHDLMVYSKLRGE
ncbi:GNAT family N-acetyltransferase [Dictyobacter kobayashii]|uniref:Alanine acetyltransferase n=1 Tax=Dictyobacter kobayashii TaxID=2014872 RepID=A0A402AUG9_9CHLR|nr:GNAT family protein [Dictyobacter kobayashii]GCE22761.1 alanine acetyltransferase [Dictyobacter kobayashii]